MFWLKMLNTFVTIKLLFIWFKTGDDAEGKNVSQFKDKIVNYGHSGYSREWILTEDCKFLK